MSMLSIRKVMLNYMNSNKTVLMGDVAFFKSILNWSDLLQQQK